MIERHNILDLLGADKRKYHSCIITCYSFDFIFFEQRILPKLRQAGITNVNIYVDAHQFEQQINSFVGSEMVDFKAGYSITPIKMSGAFHPKGLLAVGKTKGFLAIGSGNLTSSGISSNEEIWGGFHITDTDKTAAPFFKEIILYLKKLELFVTGTNRLKLNWIRENSNWFNDLEEDSEIGKIIKNKEESLEVLFTNEEKSIYNSLLKKLPLNPKSIKILSPYYNTDGSFLKKIIKDLQPDKIHCIVDTICGSLPYKIQKNLKVEFSDWNTLKRVEKYSKSRLHAKAIQIEYENETFFVFGSANASSEAFGLNINSYKNTEISILAQSNKPKDYFKKLGINFPKTGNYLIHNYDVSNLLTSLNKKRPIYLLFINNAEINSTEITIYSDKSIDYLVTISMEDANGVNILDYEINSIKEETIIEIENIQISKPFRLAIFHNSERISNYALIHQKTFLLNTNPDARIANFNSLLNSDFFGDFELEELIDFISLKSDFNENKNLNYKPANKFEEENVVEVDAISEEEFNKNSSFLIGNENFNNYTTSRIEEFLNSLNFENNSVEDVSESIEDAALEAGVNGLDGDDKSIPIIRFNVPFETGARIVYKIAKTIEKISKALHPQKANHNKIYKIAESNSLATLHQLNALLIGFHIILKKRNETFFENRSLIKLVYSDINKLHVIEKQHYIDRLENQLGNRKNEISYTLNENDVDVLKNSLVGNDSVQISYVDSTASQTLIHSYFFPKFWSNDSSHLCIKDFFLDGLSSYLLLLTKEVVVKDEKEKAVWNEKKRRLKLLSISSILSYHWASSHLDTKKLLLLNIFHYLGNNDDVKMLEKDLENYIEKLNLITFVKPESFNEVIDLYKQYLKWLKKYNLDFMVLKKPVNKLAEDSIIFNINYGFVIIRNLLNSNFANIETPLGMYHEERDLFGFTEVFIGSQPIFF